MSDQLRAQLWEMWGSGRVSHETFDKSLFVQSRGVLAKQLQQHLRSGRPTRRNVHNTVRTPVPIGASLASTPAICSGHQSSASLSATYARSTGSRASKHAFGRRARRHARSSASMARYLRRPRLRAISRLTVDGARPSARAICRNESPRARPREMSSRSLRASDPRRRLRGRGT